MTMSNTICAFQNPYSPSSTAKCIEKGYQHNCARGKGVDAIGRLANGYAENGTP